MRLNRMGSAYGVMVSLLTLNLWVMAGGAARAQALPYNVTPNYQYGTGGGLGLNHNYDYMRYGLPGVGVSPYDPIVQSQLNLGMKTARYNMYNAWSAEMYQAANLYNQQAVAQSLQNARQMQTMEPRYDVRSRTPRSVPSEDREKFTPLPRNQVLSKEGKVLWPVKTPGAGELGKARAAAEAAILAAVKEFESGGKASVQSVVEAKELLYAYGKPALKQVSGKNRAQARGLLRFLASLEQVLDSLAGF